MNKKGFTLIEMIVAIAIIGMVSLFFVTLIVGGFNITSRSQNRNQNSYNLQNGIEKADLLPQGTSTDFELNLKFGDLTIKKHVDLNVYINKNVQYVLMEDPS